MRRLNIMIIIYNKEEFSLEIFLNGISIILGIVYIIYINYPIFIRCILGNQIGMICSVLSFGCSITVNLISKKALQIF
jgi:hypothetical protein